LNQYAVIGNPVSHSLSPDLHNWVFNRLKLNAEYNRFQVDKDAISHIVEKLRDGKLDGINVTLPHKEKIIPFLDNVDIRARHINAVNCVVRDQNRLTGYNTDWYGFTMSLKQHQITITENNFILLGAGGVARSVLYTLIQKGVKIVTIVNRTPEKSESLIDSMASIGNNVSLKTVTYEKLEDIIRQYGVIVNCTPLGMTPNTGKSPLRAHLIRKDQILIDTIYTPPETQFLKDGKTAGTQTVGGLDMFIYQGLASLDLWFDNTISQRINIEELRTYLETQLSIGSTL